MKKIFLMFAFAGFTALAASAQTEPTAAASNNATTIKKEHCAAMAKSCTAAEKAACAKDAKTCCEKSGAKTSMTSKADKADLKKTVATNK